MAQILDLGKIRFQFKGEWSVATEYQFNDVVSYKGTAYVYISTAKTTGTAVSNNTFWGLMTGGFDFSGAYNDSTAYGKGSVVRYNGSLYFHSGATTTTGVDPTDIGVWTALLYQDSVSAKVFYVAPHGTDTEGSGTTLSQPFASIKYATTQAGEGATIYVKNGTYYEQLPITVGENTAVIGDSQRTVFVYPKSGNDDTGLVPNSQSTMFLMSNGSILNKMTFRGMTGWVAGSTPGDISTSTPKGCVIRFNQASPIVSKSPYVLECVAIMSGGIGALVDGSVHESGYKTMVFHEYTIINNNGVGYWMKDGGKAEIVSCFTYYCYFGYAASGGGQIRSLSGNNSYGTYGAYSKGFLASETPLTGAIVGVQLNISAADGEINVGDTVTASSGGTGVVTNLQLAANKVYIKNNTGTFTVGQPLTFSSGGTATIATGGVEGQKGFIIIAKGFASLPTPGSSLSLTGDSFTYVVSSVSGDWVDSSSEIVLLLANEKTTSSTNGTALALRKKFSQVRLTGHDFLNIGTGGITTTNYPNEPINPPAQGNEVVEDFPGRVFYTSTDQDGNFRVGDYFKVDQGTGRATLNANAFDLSGLSSLKLGSIGAQLGEQINEFSSDATLNGNSNLAVPTEYAVKTYVDTYVAANSNPMGGVVYNPSPSRTGFLACDGSVYSKSTYPALATALGNIESITRYSVLNTFFGSSNADMNNFRFHVVNNTDPFAYKFNGDGFIYKYDINTSTTLVAGAGNVGGFTSYAPYSQATLSHQCSAVYKNKFYCTAGIDNGNGYASILMTDTTTATNYGHYGVSNQGGNARVYANSTYLVMTTPEVDAQMRFTTSDPSAGTVTWTDVTLPNLPNYSCLIGNKFLYSANATWTGASTVFVYDLITNTNTEITPNTTSQLVAQGYYGVSDGDLSVWCGNTSNNYFTYRASTNSFGSFTLPAHYQTTLQRIEYQAGLWCISGYYTDRPATGSQFIPFIFVSYDGLTWTSFANYKYPTTTSATNMPNKAMIGNNFFGITSNTAVNDSNMTVFKRRAYNTTTQFMTPYLPAVPGAYPLIKT